MKKFRKYLSAVVLVAALALPAAAFAQAQDRDRDDKPRAEKREKGEREAHPVIEAAIRQLEQVKYELTHKAASDFKGHKVEAIRSIDEAIRHLHEALEADKR